MEDIETENGFLKIYPGWPRNLNLFQRIFNEIWSKRFKNFLSIHSPTRVKFNENFEYASME